MQNLKSKKTSDDLDVSSLTPTPLYNLAILEDVTIFLHHQILQKAILPYTNMCQCIQLIKVWLSQRDLRFHPEGFDGHQIALLLAYLIQTKRITPTSEPEVAFQSFLHFMSLTDFTQHELDFSSSSLLSKDAYPEGYQPSIVLKHMLVASSGERIDTASKTSYNIFWRVSASVLTTLQSEAKRSVQEIQSHKSINSFDLVFIQKHGFFDTHDAFYHFDLPTWSVILSQLSDSNDEKIELEQASLHMPIYTYFAQKALALVQRALGDRVLTANVNIRCLQPFVNASAENHPDHTHMLGTSIDQIKYVISIGIVLNKDKVFRRVERGPPPAAIGEASSLQSQKEIDDFKHFWGSKCQLRRFKDGSITESVVWDDFHNHSDMIDAIVSYILTLHLPYLLQNTTSSLRTIHSQVQLGHLYDSEQVLASNSLTIKANQAFDELRGILMSKMANLPLHYDNVMAIAPSLRYTALFPAAPHPLVELSSQTNPLEHEDIKALFKEYHGRFLSLLTAPIPIVAKFESSGKWPNESKAILKCKAAFLLKTRDELLKTHKITSIIHDNNTLDVFYQGYVFRLIPYANYETEKIVSEEMEEGDDPLGCTPEEITNKHWVIPPLHHNAIKALHVTYPVYGETVQLFRYWLAKHHYSGHICQEAIELLVAYEFIHPSSVYPPSTSLAGLYRTLQRLVHHNWEEDAFIVELGEQTLTTEIRNKVIMKLRSIRQSIQNNSQEITHMNPHYYHLINPTMYMISTCDQSIEYESALHTKSPEQVVFNLILQAARYSLNKLKMLMENIYLPAVVSSSSSASLVDHEHQEKLLLTQIFTSQSIMKRCDIRLRFNKTLSNIQIDQGPSFGRLEIFANTPMREYSYKNLLIIDDEYVANPIQGKIFHQLKESFDAYAVFFWDETLGNEIGVLLRPNYKQKQEFGVMNAQYRQLIASTNPSDEMNEEDVTSNSNKKRTNESLQTIANIDELIQHMIESSGGYLSVASNHTHEE